MYIRISLIAQFVEDDELRFRQHLLASGFDQNLVIRCSNQIVPSGSSEKAREQLLDAQLAAC